MNERALQLIELPAILARLSDAAASEPGRALALALRPSAHPTEVAHRQRLTSEAIGVLERADEPDLHGLHDVRDEAELAARGAALDPAALRRAADTIRAGLAARGVFGTPECPSLAELVDAIDPALAPLAETIEGSVEDDGSDLRDGASPALRRLRRELREGRARLAERLRRFAHDSGVKEHLSEDFVTERAGRPVIALRASARSAVPGLVHDTSSSGQTLFVEPFAVVEDSNRLREAESAEREEVVRILRALSGAVGAAAETLDQLVDATARVDLALASAALSRAWRGCEVVTSDCVRLVAARHPLLDAAVAVPIDLELCSLRALIVSGPNTGGKTVALKTVGLVAALHQCGLRPPADEVELPVFDEILVDIGDEQSIAMSLSTFSGHLRSLVEILDSATDRSLVLLDEVAAGTDPTEGAALAQALLERLAGQARLTIATSHYGELKEWAATAPAVENAATGFDIETDLPLYRIEVGRPGTSHALRVAERLGLPSDVVGAARERVHPDRLRIADLLAQAEITAQEAVAARSRAAGLEQATAARERELADLTRELEEERNRVRESAERERTRARREAEVELTEARAELEALRREIRTARAAERRRQRAAAGPNAAERDRDRSLGRAAERARGVSNRIAATEAPLAPLAPLAVGDPVIAPSLGVRGTIVELGTSEATVIGIGGLRVRIPTDRLRPDRDAASLQADAPPAVRVPAVAPADVPLELDLRGKTAQEAREAVRGFIDDATLAGHPEVRVIHGRGTGAVRKAVRDEIAKHPLAGETTSDSADGATVVRLGPARDHES
ncbi:MAG: Smr/MutS family protein [Gaiellales bacterium]